MTGWRIGWAVAPSEVAKAMGSLQSHSTSNPTSFAQWGALAALEGSQDAVEEMRRKFEAHGIDLQPRRPDPPASANHRAPGVRFYLFVDISALLGKRYQGTTIDSGDTLHPSRWSRRQLHWCREADLGWPNCLRLSYATSRADSKGLSRIKSL